MDKQLSCLHNISAKEQMKKKRKETLAIFGNPDYIIENMKSNQSTTSMNSLIMTQTLTLNAKIINCKKE